MKDQEDLVISGSPRVCGKKRVPWVSAPVPAGSPPRMREKDWKTVHIPCHPRITPAYAGKRLGFIKGRNIPSFWANIIIQRGIDTVSSPRQ